MSADSKFLQNLADPPKESTRQGGFDDEDSEHKLAPATRLSQIQNMSNKSMCEKLSEAISSLKDVRTGKTKLVDHPFFEGFIAMMIILNTIMIGIEVDHDLGFAGLVLGYTFATAWVLEAVLKIVAYGPKGYFCSASNLFDFMLCLTAVLDAYILPELPGDTNANQFTVLRILRFGRVLRLVRLVKMFRDLWMLCIGLVNSLSALSWTLILMGCTIYGFGVFFAIVVGRDCDGAYSEWKWCEDYYGSLARSMYTLFEIMTLELSGVRSVITTTPVLMAPMMIFITMASFGLMNIVMGVIVEKVLDAANANTEKLALEQAAQHKMELAWLGAIFKEADVDGSGEVSLEEWLAISEREDVQSLFDHLELPITRKTLATRMFEVLDSDQDGRLSIGDFLERTFSLKQEGKSCCTDMTMMLLDVRSVARRAGNIGRRVDRIEKVMDQKLETLISTQQELNQTVSSLRTDVSSMQKDIAALKSTAAGENSVFSKV